MSAIPRNVAAAIEKLWPDGVVEQFFGDDLYFYRIHGQLELDLRKIAGASLRWQTETEGYDWSGDDDDDFGSREYEQFQSYHVFFLVPEGDGFTYTTETESLEEPGEDQDYDDWEEATATVPGQGWIGCAVGICLAARFALIATAQYEVFEDGTSSPPDLGMVVVTEKTGEPVDTEEFFRKSAGERNYGRLEELRGRIDRVLRAHRITVLKQAIQDLEVPDLSASEEVYLSPPLRVRDAFFFRGV